MDRTSAHNAFEEAIYNPEHKNTKMVSTKAINRDSVPDMSSGGTLQQQALLVQAPTHVADLVLDPALRTDVVTMRDSAAFDKSNYFPYERPLPRHSARYRRGPVLAGLLPAAHRPTPLGPL